MPVPVQACELGMHVLFYTSSLGGGGAEKHVQRLANAIQDEGHRVAVAVARQGGSYEQDLSDDVKQIVLSDGWIKSSTWRLMQSVRPLRRYLSRRNPDIVCGVMNHVNIRLMRAVRGLEERPATVVSVQDNPYEKYGKGTSLRNRIRFWRMKRQYPYADRIVALSNGVGKSLCEMGLAERDQISVIPNVGVDKEVLEKKDAQIPKSQLPSRKALVVSCGRLTPIKGYSYLLDAFQKVRSRMPAELRILGDGELRDELEDKIDALDLNNDVELLGFRGNPFRFMRAADAFVLSSLSEGFGNVIVEAMACGTPVVSTNCPHGPGEIITHQENGLLVPPADADALSKALLRVLRNQDLQERLAENGRERARDFHASEIAQEYLKVFRRLVESE